MTPPIFGRRLGNFIWLGLGLLFLGIIYSQTAALQADWLSASSSGNDLPAPQLITDLNIAGIGSNPSSFVRFKGEIYFVATDENGRNLWKTDGTSSGTERVKHIDPTSSRLDSLFGPLVMMGDHLYFIGSDGVNGRELWQSDGTESGTIMLKDINPTGDAFGLTAGRLLPVGSTLYFFTTNGAYTLWQTDGTESGTVQLDPNEALFTNPSSFAGATGRLYFTAENSDGVRSLFLTNGSEVGTAELLDNSDNPLAEATNLTIFEDELFFTIDPGGLTGHQLWRSDGTPAGTVQVFQFPSTTLSLGQLTPVGNELFFVATFSSTGPQLWKTDGNELGTELVRDMTDTGLIEAPSKLTNVDGQLAFIGDEQTHGQELWRSDGTTNGTELVREITPDGDTRFEAFVVADDLLFFAVLNDENVFEIWRSDLTSSGTTLFGVDEMPNGIAGKPRLVVDQTLYFASSNDAEDGAELWRSDGSATGTTLVANVNPTTAASGVLFPGTNHEPQPVGDHLFFMADVENEWAIWRSDRTPAGTEKASVQPLSGGPSDFYSPTFFLPTEDEKAVYYRDDYELWRIDALTLENTAVYTETAVLDRCAAAVNHLFFFCAASSDTGWELRVTDGTPQQSLVLTELTSSRPEMFAFQGRLVFSNPELWVTDGTVSETIPLMSSDESHSVQSLTQTNDSLFFLNTDEAHGQELWTSDGTVAGTRLVKDIYPGEQSARLSYLTPVGDRLFFLADDGEHGQELWVSDGTETGTVMVFDSNPAGDTTLIPRVGTQQQLFFEFDDDIHGLELWVSDGTEPGTRLLKDVNPTGNGVTNTFARGYQTTYFTLHNYLFASLDDGVVGTELWVSDGTELGTYLVQDLNPYGDAFPGYIGHMGGGDSFLYFTADDGSVSFELWYLDLSNIIREGVRLSSDLDAKNGLAGTLVGYEMLVTNIGEAADSFAVTAVSDWSTSLQSPTVMLQPGESRMFEVTVLIPPYAAGNEVETTVVTATSQNNPDYRETAVLTTTAHKPMRIFLPLTSTP